jgi:hypothetical protein
MDTPTKPLKDSGKRQEFETGAVRDTQEGKGRFDLLPLSVLVRDAQHVQAGAIKYGDRNWEKGQPLSRFFDSAMRHLLKLAAGHTDEDHGAAARWNIAAFMQTKAWIDAGVLPADLDDTAYIARSYPLPKD